MQNTQQIPEPAKYVYKKSSYAETYEVLQSLLKDEVFCDIKLATEDGGVIFCHKVILASASPYFHAMFTHFAEKNQNHVVIRELDNSALQLLIDFVYSGEITVTEKNVQVLLSASNLLQLQDAKKACCDFLLAQLGPSNVIGVIALADLFSCMELLNTSEQYVQNHFLDVVEEDEFLSLSFEQMVKLISSNKLRVPSEEKVFESVIRWVNHDLGHRKCVLPTLMEHIRLPLTSQEYIIEKVAVEPLTSNCVHSTNYAIEALHFILFKDVEQFKVPHNNRTKPRQPSGAYKLGRSRIGLRVLNNLLYAVGGFDGVSTRRLKSVECYHPTLDEWTPVTEICVGRSSVGVGALNGVLYAVGGYDGSNTLRSVEAYRPSTGVWTSVADMHLCRYGAGVAALDGLLYAIGGSNELSILDSVECYNPNTNTWTIVTVSMNISRGYPGVVGIDS